MATRRRHTRPPRNRRPAGERRRLAALSELTRHLAAVDESADGLTLVVNEAARLLGVDGATLRLLENDELVVRASTRWVTPAVAPARIKVVESLSGRAVVRGEPLVIEDLHHARIGPTGGRDGFRGILAVPVRAGAAVVGVLDFYTVEPRRFASEDVRVAATLADHAALALEKERLLQESRDRAGHLLALARLNQFVSSSLDIDEVLGAIARAAADLMAVPVVLVWSADEPKRTLTLRAFSDPALAEGYPAMVVTFDDGAAGWVAVHRRPVDIPDLTTDSRVKPGAAAWARAHGFTSATFLPIVFQDTLLGVVALGGSAPVVHKPDARQLLEGFVAQAAVAIRNARLYAELRSANERLERRTRDLGALTRMAEVLQACITEDEAYVVAARFAGELFAEESGAVFVTSPSHNLVEARAAWGGFRASEASLFKPEQCWALRRSRLHAVDDTGSGVLCEHLPRPLPAASLCVPLAAQGESLGILYLGTRAGAAAGLDEDKQQLAQTVAEQLGLAVANLKLRETLRNQSIRDPLTGLFNRRYMEETLERELRRAERGQRSLCVVMLDLDDFKGLNDGFGHEAGDRLLAELGRLLRANLRRGDVVCRYGGEEFVLILPEAGVEDGRRRVEQLREAVRELSVTHRGQPIAAPTFSGGLAVFPDNGTTVEDLLRAADAALYAAKHRGRDRLVTAERTAGS